MSLIKIDESKLTTEGFTQSGVKRYVATISEYSGLVFDRSKKFGEARKASDSSVEINYEHVQSAVKVISSDYGTDKVPNWKLWIQALEYLLTAGCGFLASKASSTDAPPHFIILFVLTAVIGVGLFIFRMTSTK